MRHTSITVLLRSAAALAAIGPLAAQQTAIPEGFTRQDQLRGAVTPER